MPRYRYTSDTSLVFLDLPDGCRILAPGDVVDLPDDSPYTSHAWLEPAPDAEPNTTTDPADTAAEEH